jgi:uncharacterized lipoprotein YddW (UPF0748 family)
VRLAVLGTLALALLLPSAASAARVAGPAAPTEVRGLWVVRTGLVSPAEVDQVVEHARAGGFNALFVQVRGRGDAFYSSQLVARSGLLEGQPASFDPLARLLEKAHAQGMAVHAWVNVLLTSHFPSPSPDNVVVRHPSWVMVPRQVARTAVPKDPMGLLWLVRQTRRTDADVEGFYITPSSEEVQAHLEAVVRELLGKYDVQGIHLDFIRYPNEDYDWSVAALEGFRRQQGGNGDLLQGPVLHPEAWEQYRRSVLTGLAERLSSAARAARPGIIVSAAVVPDEAAAVHHRFQDWPAWLSKGILDAVCPMTYTPDTRLFREQVLSAQSLAKPGQEVWAGVGAYRLTIDDTIEKILTARRSGAAGVVIFSHESLPLAALRRLAAEAFTP